jgi:hypothetical protein
MDDLFNNIPNDEGEVNEPQPESQPAEDIAMDIYGEDGDIFTTELDATFVEEVSEDE